MKFVIYVFTVILLIIVLGNYSLNFHFENSKANAQMQVQTLSSGDIQNKYYDSINTNSSKNESEKVDTDNCCTPVKGLQGITDIKVNSPSALSYTTKYYVYNLRKMYVQKSIFANNNYNPSEEVFGQIVDNKPWIASNSLFDDKPLRTDGTSEETRFINNPAVLAAVQENYGTYNPNSTNLDSISSDPDVQYIPRKIQYDSNKNEITVEYHMPNYPKEYVIKSISLKGINARDFGYKYAFIDVSKSTLGMRFLESDNISNQIIEFKDFIHLGGACGVEGGCNNGSPKQPMLEFEPYFKSSNAEGEIYIKFWRNKPFSPLKAPDITEKIVLKK